MANKAINDLLKYGVRLIDWTQPTLTSNGTVGGSSFACTGYATQQQGEFYYAFDNNGATRWVGYHVGCYITIYNPKKIKVSSINIVTSDQHINGLSLFGSNDNSNWNELYSGYIS